LVKTYLEVLHFVHRLAKVWNFPLKVVFEFLCVVTVSEISVVVLLILVKFFGAHVLFDVLGDIKTLIVTVEFNDFIHRDDSISIHVNV